MKLFPDLSHFKHTIKSNRLRHFRVNERTLLADNFLNVVNSKKETKKSIARKCRSLLFVTRKPEHLTRKREQIYYVNKAMNILTSVEHIPTSILFANICLRQIRRCHKTLILLLSNITQTGKQTFHTHTYTRQIKFADSLVQYYIFFQYSPHLTILLLLNNIIFYIMSTKLFPPSPCRVEEHYTILVICWVCRQSPHEHF